MWHWTDLESTGADNWGVAIFTLNIWQEIIDLRAEMPDRHANADGDTLTFNLGAAPSVARLVIVFLPLRLKILK